jgi:hypothetical protein
LQTILSAFSNSGNPSESALPSSAAGATSGGGNGFGEYLNLGTNFGLGSALNQKKRKRRQSLELPNFFTLLEGIGRKAKERRQQRQHSPQQYPSSGHHHSPMTGFQSSPPLSRLARPVQSNSPIVRLTDNFGRNFFQVGQF